MACTDALAASLSSSFDFNCSLSANITINRDTIAKNEVSSAVGHCVLLNVQRIWILKLEIRQRN